jgi:MYXO-CTERM domain-containing protein
MHRGHSAVWLVAMGLLWPLSATAHFVLVAPPNWMSQDALGLPIKLGPCGDEGGGTPTGVVTPFRPGQTITVTVNETIFHPGHYRIALAVHDRSELPAEPPVTAGSTPCGTVPIQNPPVFPVLADGVLTHTAPFPGPQSIQVTLPANLTCSKCTLQVIEFMSDHDLNIPGGCFYHHCADLSIQPTGADASHPSSGCAISDASASGGLWIVLVAVAVEWTRRRRRGL